MALKLRECSRLFLFKGNSRICGVTTETLVDKIRINGNMSFFYSMDELFYIGEFNCCKIYKCKKSLSFKVAPCNFLNQVISTKNIHQFCAPTYSMFMTPNCISYKTKKTSISNIVPLGGTEFEIIVKRKYRPPILLSLSSKIAIDCRIPLNFTIPNSKLLGSLFESVFSSFPHISEKDIRTVHYYNYFKNQRALIKQNKSNSHGLISLYLEQFEIMSNAKLFNIKKEWVKLVYFNEKLKRGMSSSKDAKSFCKKELKPQEVQHFSPTFAEECLQKLLLLKSNIPKFFPPQKEVEESLKALLSTVQRSVGILEEN